MPPVKAQPTRLLSSPFKTPPRTRRPQTELDTNEALPKRKWRSSSKSSLLQSSSSSKKIKRGTACTNCKLDHRKCETSKPCRECERRGVECDGVVQEEDDGEEEEDVEEEDEVVVNRIALSPPHTPSPCCSELSPSVVATPCPVVARAKPEITFDIERKVIYVTVPKMWTVMVRTHTDLLYSDVSPPATEALQSEVEGRRGVAAVANLITTMDDSGVGGQALNDDCSVAAWLRPSVSTTAPSTDQANATIITTTGAQPFQTLLGLTQSLDYASCIRPTLTPPPSTTTLLTQSQSQSPPNHQDQPSCQPQVFQPPLPHQPFAPYPPHQAQPNAALDSFSGAPSSVPSLVGMPCSAPPAWYPPSSCQAALATPLLNLTSTAPPLGLRLGFGDTASADWDCGTYYDVGAWFDALG